jgi:hypothetical protein
MPREEIESPIGIKDRGQMSELRLVRDCLCDAASREAVK